MKKNIVSIVDQFFLQTLFSVINVERNKFVQGLIFIIILNVTICGMLWRLDVFVNVDLYGSGLWFSLDWAKDYWYNSGLVWLFQVGCVTLSGLAIFPHYIYSLKSGGFSKWLGFLLPTLAGVC